MQKQDRKADAHPKTRNGCGFDVQRSNSDFKPIKMSLEDIASLEIPSRKKMESIKTDTKNFVSSKSRRPQRNVSK